MNNPLYTIDRIAERSADTKLGFALTGLTVALVAAMAINEFRRMFRSESRNFDRDECSRHQR